MLQRMVKSDEEIDLIRNGAQVADIGGAACVEAIGEGVSEHEIALHSTSAMVREIAHRYPESDIMDTWTWFSLAPTSRVSRCCATIEPPA